MFNVSLSVLVHDENLVTVDPRLLVVVSTDSTNSGLNVDKLMKELRTSSDFAIALSLMWGFLK